MVVRARVLPLERSRERRHRFEVRALEKRALAPLDAKHVTQVACVQQELFLLRRRRRGRTAGGIDPAIASRSTMESSSSGLKGLRTTASAPASSSRSEPVRRTTGRARVSARGLQAPAEFRARLAGHDDVEYDDVGFRSADSLLRLDDGAGLVDHHLRALEGDPQEFPERGLVVDEKDPHHPGLPVGSPGHAHESPERVRSSRRSPGRFSYRGVPPRRIRAGAGRARTSGRRGPRGGPP